MKLPNAALRAAAAEYCLPPSPFDVAAEKMRTLDPHDRERLVTDCIARVGSARGVRPYVARVCACISHAIEPASGYTGILSQRDLCYRADLSTTSLDRAIGKLIMLGAIVAEPAVASTEPAWRFTMHLPVAQQASDDGNSTTKISAPSTDAPGRLGIRTMAHHRARLGRSSPVSEAAIQRTVIEHLKWRPASTICWFAVPNGGARRKTEAAILSGHGVISGVPDLILIARGRVYGLELKAHNGRLSDAQRAFQELMRSCGAIVETTYGLDAALATLERWHLLRAQRSRAPP